MHQRSKIFWMAMVAVGLLATSSPAAAQDKNDPLADQLDNYWTTDRDLPTLQNKLYKRDGRFGIGLYGGLFSSEPFWWYIPVGGRLTYFFTDHVGLELGGQWMGSASSPGPLTNPTEIHDFFAAQLEGGFDADTDLEDRFLWRANALLVWSPLYGKWAFTKNKLSHFDMNLSLGGGAVSVLRPDYERTAASTVIEPELVFGGGVHFYLSNHVVLRLDGRGYVYRGADTPSAREGYEIGDDTAAADDPSYFKRLQVPSEFLLGVTFLF